MHCVALVPDMIFATKIRATANAVGVDVTVVGSLNAFRDALGDHNPKLVLVDLDGASCSPLDAVALAVGHQPRPQVVAYCSHVQTELQQSAAEAGAHEVWPRSRFVTELPFLLQGPLDGLQRE